MKSRFKLIDNHNFIFRATPAFPWHGSISHSNVILTCSVKQTTCQSVDEFLKNPFVVFASLVIYPEILGGSANTGTKHTMAALSMMFGSQVFSFLLKFALAKEFAFSVGKFHTWSPHQFAHTLGTDAAAFTQWRL